MSRLSEIFSRARAEHRCALIPYITAGDPALDASIAIAVALAEAGADVIELGIPHSDPVADGPVIQRATERSLRQGTRMADVFELTRRLRERTGAGILLFSYYNPVLHYGLEAFGRDAAAAGADGVLITDLIPEEATEHRTIMAGAGLDTVFLAAPTSPDERLRTIAAASTGFIYAVSRTGVTGARQTVPSGARELVSRLRRCTALPIALGFGLSTPEQVAEVATFADAAVVGTALVQTIADVAAPGAAPVTTVAAAAGEFLRALSGGQVRPAAGDSPR